MSLNERISVSFDEDNRIRILEADKFKESEKLKSESLEFIKKVLSVEEIMNSLVEVLEAQAKKVDESKLKALRIRNQVENEADYRKQKIAELTNLINEKKTELEKSTIEYESLQKVETEQKLLLEKLSNNEF